MRGEIVIEKQLKLMGDLTDLLTKSKNPVIAWSGGKDSTLLVTLALQMNFKPAVLSFPHFWTVKQMEFMTGVVDQNKLTVFNYSPTEINYQPPYITATYWMGGVPIKLIMDHIPTKRCGIDVGRKATAESALQPAYLWDVTVVGTKKTDRHELVHDFTFQDTDKHRFATPLWDWTDDEVVEAAKTFGVNLDLRAQTDDPEGDTGNFMACMACVGHKERVYCPKVNKYIQGV